jgi:hypothetical protein
VLTVGPTASADVWQDMQYFAPADTSTYGARHRPSEGFFFSYDGLFWGVSQPASTPIGQPSDDGRLVWYSDDPADTATQHNTHNTGQFGALIRGGERFEFGFVHNRRGILFSAFRLNPHTHNLNVGDMDMVWDDREWGGPLDYKHLDGYVDAALTVIRPLPVTFNTAKIHNRVKTWGLEAMYIIRSRPMHRGGIFEFFAGARYLEFNEDFALEAYGLDVQSGVDEDDPTTTPSEPDTIYTGTLANTFINCDANNHIVGPQLGVRYFNKYGRWTLSSEGRFFAGFNSQSIHQYGILGTELAPPGGQDEPLSMGPTSFNHTWNEPEWSPCIEVRAMLEWQWTRSVMLGVGWTGIWMDGIARPSNMINYELGETSTMGIIHANNRQDVFINGVNFRVVINR